MLASTVTSTSREARPKADARTLRHVVVLGANGTMGYGSGALFTRSVERVTFLARTKGKAEEGLKAAIDQVRSSTVGSRVDCGSYDEDFDRVVGQADLIFEAVTEQLPLKREFFARIDRARRPDSIVATVTSGLSINQLAEECSESFRRNFLGLHFFNPPNVIVGTELIAGRDTDPALVDFIEAYCVKHLGRVMVRTSDTPGFAGNRVGFKVLNECAILAEEHGPLLMEKLVGPYTGRALTPLATIDLVGWDIHRAIVDNVYENAPDEARATNKLPAYMGKLMGEGTLGRKSGKGFFMRDGKRKLVLDPKSGRYVPEEEVKLPDLGYIEKVADLHRIGRYEDAMHVFLEAKGPEAKLARKVVAGYIAYAFHRVGEVTETITGIDGIMGFGFNWAPPSVLVDALGVPGTLAMLREAGLEAPPLLANAQKGGKPARFFHMPGVSPGRFFVAG